MNGWTFLKPAAISWRVLVGAPLILLAATSFSSCSVNAATCESLAALTLPETTITLAKAEAAGTLTPTQLHWPGAPLENLPAFCRVAGEIKPTSDSDIKFELWMPASGWNGKFIGTGNGGWAGQIWYSEIAEALRRGYAAANSDTGHEGGGASFAVGHPEKLIDFGYRAIHENPKRCHFDPKTLLCKGAASHR